MQHDKFGIYLNPKEMMIVRINSPYWIPPAPDWVMVTPEVNATLLKVRELAREKKLVSEPDKITWGNLPQVRA
ncbi:MAG: hypothetical protein HY671_13520 [Chloroflexi bacterium]|nr:hypothetical protein [Chloroflexota bacterium]